MLLECLTQWGMDLIRASCHYCGCNNPDGDTTTIINNNNNKSIKLPPPIKTIIIIIMLFFPRRIIIALAVQPSYCKLYRKSVKVLISEVLRKYLFI